MNFPSPFENKNVALFMMRLMTIIMKPCHLYVVNGEGCSIRKVSPPPPSCPSPAPAIRSTENAFAHSTASTPTPLPAVQAVWYRYQNRQSVGAPVKLSGWSCPSRVRGQLLVVAWRGDSLDSFNETFTDNFR